MTVTADEKPDTDPTLLRLNPEAATNFAHDLHCSQDEYADDQSKGVSNKVLPVLDALSADPASRHGWFLAQMRSIIVSYGHAMTHLKKQHAQECIAAEIFLQTRSNQLNQSQQMKVLYQAVKKVVWAGVAGVITFLLTKILALVGYVPESLLNQQGHTDSYVSFTVGLLTVVVIGLVQNWLGNYSQNRIDKEYNNLIQLSHLRYAESLGIQLDVNWGKLCWWWKWYTGEEWGEMPAYLRVNRKDLEFALLLKQLMREKSQSNAMQILGIGVKVARDGFARVRKKKTE
jgi:hypothetical protein